MIDTKGKFEAYKGSSPAGSPTALPDGIFSLCSGGAPIRGAFGRIPGKTLRDKGIDAGAAISIFQFGQKVVVQRWIGLEIYDLTEVSPNEADYVTDNDGRLVYDNSGIPITS